MRCVCVCVCFLVQEKQFDWLLTPLQDLPHKNLSCINRTIESFTLIRFTFALSRYGGNDVRTIGSNSHRSAVSSESRFVLYFNTCGKRSSDRFAFTLIFCSGHNFKKGLFFFPVLNILLVVITR